MSPEMKFRQPLGSPWYPSKVEHPKLWAESAQVGRWEGILRAVEGL